MVVPSPVKGSVNGFNFPPRASCAPREPLPNRKASRIAAYSAGDVTQQDAYADYIDWFIQSSIRLREALAPYAPAALAASSRDPAT
jgi:hypothetical protein